MQHLHQTDWTVRDRLRLALVSMIRSVSATRNLTTTSVSRLLRYWSANLKRSRSAVSDGMCLHSEFAFPDLTTLVRYTAFVLKLKQIHLTQINYRADQGVFTSHSGPDSVPTSQFDENQKLLSDGLCSANSQVATLEQEVRVLKRKLMIAEIGKYGSLSSAAKAHSCTSSELLQKTTPLHDQSPNDVRIPDPPAKRTKITATVSSASASPHAYASPALLVAKSGATSLEKVNSRRNGTSTSLPANEAAKHPYTSEPTSAGKEKSAVAVGVDGGTGADDRVDDVLQELATTTTVTDHGISMVNPGPRGESGFRNTSSTWF